MHRRAWIGIFAILAVLLHGAALVRHHSMMLSAALAAELGVICVPGAPGGWSTATHGPGEPAAPHPSAPDCPICSAHGSAILARTAEITTTRIAWVQPRPWPPRQHAPTLRLAAQPPPARGPPYFV